MAPPGRKFDTLRESTCFFIIYFALFSLSVNSHLAGSKARQCRFTIGCSHVGTSSLCYFVVVLVLWNLNHRLDRTVMVQMNEDLRFQVPYMPTNLTSVMGTPLEDFGESNADLSYRDMRF
ncbi:hypothetical protein R1flu_020507 [Riccia fluitans]|uniref:Transmembrane protein n=1 Tax=Riccia fluitans TaxID=41844 RepID=A0ABD1ZLQ3_9MARC